MSDVEKLKRILEGNFSSEQGLDLSILADCMAFARDLLQALIDKDILIVDLEE